MVGVGSKSRAAHAAGRIPPGTDRAALRARAAGRQFEDDENRLPLESFWTAGVFLSHAVSRLAQAYVAIENVLDRDVET